MLCSCCYYAVILLIVYKILDYLIRIPKIWGYQGRHILVTGCDSGFGQGVALRLDKLGCHVHAGCLTEDGQAELRRLGSSKLAPLSMDVADPASVRRAYATVKDRLPAGTGLWGVLNNAGVAGRFGPTEWLKIEDYKHVMGINLHGLIDVSITFMPLVKLARGRVVNTASVVGRTTMPGSVPYCVSKHGVEVFSDGLRRELRLWKCSVHLIEPGVHRTDFFQEQRLNRDMQFVWDRLDKGMQDDYGSDFFEKTKHYVTHTFLDLIATEGVDDVVSAYEHALLGMFPRARYLVGLDAKLFWIPHQTLLPEWLGDWLLTSQQQRAGLVPAACQ